MASWLVAKLPGGEMTGYLETLTRFLRLLHLREVFGNSVYCI